jgi:hypothetical protein
MEKKIIELTQVEQGWKCLICGKKDATVKLTVNRLLSYDDTVIGFRVCDDCLAKMQNDIQKACE